MAVFEIDAGALVAAATAFGGAVAGGIIAGARIVAKAWDRSTEALLANERALGRVESGVVERIERESSGVVEVPLAQSTTPRLRQYPRADSKPKQGG